MVKHTKDNYIKINKKYLIGLVLILSIVLIAFWYGRIQGVNSIPQQKENQENNSPKAIPSLSPTLAPINSNNSNIQLQQNKEKVAVVNAINQKMLYCDSNGVDAVRDINSQLQYEKDRADNVLVEQDRCNNSCRQKTDEILKQCESSSDYENCIKKCGNDCYNTAQRQLEDIKKALIEKTKIFNEVASKYCVK